jgi:hypothetical protein
MAPRVVHRDTAQPLQHTGIVDARAAPLRVAGDQRVLVGAGAMHPVQRARHTQARLVEPGHRSVGDALAGHLEQLLQPAGGAFGHGRHRALGDRGAEQLGQCGRGVLPRQELPDVQVKDDRGDPKAVLHWCGHACGASADVVTPQVQRRAMS